MSLIKTLLLASSLMVATFSVNAVEQKHSHDHAGAAVQKSYNGTMNPRQNEYPNHLGFNDLHIQAIRHMVPDTDSNDDPLLQVVVHHHCKAYDDNTLICLMFHTGMKDQDKPMGFEYIIPTSVYETLPEEEKKYWHYHLTEVPRAKATFPDLTAEEGAKLLPIVNETYGKVIYFKKPHDDLPLGEPYVVIVQDMPEQD